MASNETIFIHSNATTFVSGETLYYKAYCLNPVDNTFSPISKIAYVSLLDENKQTVFTTKIYLENGIGQGDFFIGTNLASGVYKMIGYTNWMLNKTAPAIFETDIIVINPFELHQSDKKNSPASELKTDRPTTPNTTISNSDTGKILSLDLNKKLFSTREKVDLKIKSLTAPLEKGNYSLSVRKIDGLPTKKQVSAQKFIKSYPNEINTAPVNEKIQYLPELRGELITGSITSKNGSKEVNDKTIALSFPGKDFAFKLIKTNSLGNFVFILDKDPINPNVAIQITDSDRNDYNIHLNKPTEFKTTLLKSSAELQLTENDRKTIEAHSIANQIQNAYYYERKDSLQSDPKVNLFFHPLEKDYILDDYTRFPSLKETITEVVREMYFKQKGNDYSFHIRTDNFNKEELPEPSLVLVDGVLIQDINELIDYKTENVYKISIVPGAYFYGPKLFNGIINIITKNNDYFSKSARDYMLKTDVLRPLSKKTYYKQDYADKTKYERIPDYRYQLLWLPDVNTADETTISFYTSDVTGTFEIVLEGFTAKGIPVSLQENFEVK